MKAVLRMTGAAAACLMLSAGPAHAARPSGPAGPDDSARDPRDAPAPTQERQ